MSVSDADLADACEATYVGAPQTFGSSVVHAYVSIINGVNVMAFEGTQSPQEWIIDILGATPEDTNLCQEKIGMVHRGWYEDVLAVYPEALAYIKKVGGPWAITGHSKGASEALICAAMLTYDKITLNRVATFGTPHPGALAGLLRGIPGADYRNLTDPVWDVPCYLDHPKGRDMEHLFQQGATNDPWGPLKDHRIQLYQAGTRLLFPDEA